MKRKGTWPLILAAWTACQVGNGNQAVPDVPDTDRDETSVDLREVPLDGSQKDEASQLTRDPIRSSRRLGRTPLETSLVTSLSRRGLPSPVLPPGGRRAISRPSGTLATR